MNPQNQRETPKVTSATNATNPANPSTTSTSKPRAHHKNTVFFSYNFYRQTISERGLPYVYQSRNLAIFKGIFQGIALVLLLPAASALAKARPVWGLGITGWLVVFAVIAVVGAVLDYVMSMKVFYAALDFVQSVHRIIGDKIARIPLGWFKPGTAGRFSRLVSSEMMQMGEVMAHQLWQMGTAVGSLLTILIGAFFWDWRLGVTLLVAIPAYAGLLRVSQFCKQRGDNLAKPAEVELANRLVEFATCQGTLRAAGVGAGFEPLQRAVAENERMGRKNLWWSLLGMLISGAFAQIVLVLMIVIAGWLAIGGQMGPIEAIAFIGISLRFVSFIEDIGQSVVGIEDRRHLLDETQEILEAPELPEPAGSGVSVAELSVSVGASSVSPEAAGNNPVSGSSGSAGSSGVHEGTTGAANATPQPAEPASAVPPSEAKEAATRPGVTAPTPAGAGQSVAPAIELQDVTFGYDADKPVLRDVNFTVPTGTMCALVGPSGSGKTTISRLIARFWDVDHGKVIVGGRDVRQQTISHLMNQLSLVFQDVYLFDDTLEANILVGNPQATHEQVEAAAHLAGVTEIVNRLPQGYDTPVGEGGRALSGGERQRVSVARALLKQAPIVLLDEATSALDAENEANIVAAMDELRRHATLLVIAHKMETIAGADQVVVLGEDGRVEAVGTHAEMLARPGTYQRYWQQREEAAGWRLV